MTSQEFIYIVTNPRYAVSNYPQMIFPFGNTGASFLCNPVLSLDTPVTYSLESTSFSTGLSTDCVDFLNLPDSVVFL